MAEDSPVTDPATGAPQADTSGGTQVDTTGNTQQAQQPTEDWQARYTNLQSTYTRETQRRRELEDQLLSLRAQQPQTPAIDPADPLATQRAELEQERQRIRQEREWAEAERRYPPEVVAAYRAAERNWRLDPSPLGAINGFIEGVQALAANAANPQPAAAPTAAQLPTRAQAVEPTRVDTSRSDVPDPDAIAKEIAGAKASHDLFRGVKAILGMTPATPTKQA